MFDNFCRYEESKEENDESFSINESASIPLSEASKVKPKENKRVKKSKKKDEEEKLENKGSSYLSVAFKNNIYWLPVAWVKPIKILCFIKNLFLIIYQNRLIFMKAFLSFNSNLYIFISRSLESKEGRT